MRITARAYSSDGDRDLARMRALIQDAWRLAGPHFEWSTGDLSWRLFRFPNIDPAETVQLFEDVDQHLHAFTWFAERTGLDVALHPSAPDETCAALLGSFPSDVCTAVWVLESHTRMTTALAAAGYEPREPGYLHFARSLRDPPLPPPVLPDSYQLRAVTGPAEAWQRAEVHRGAFGSTRVSAASYTQLMRAPGYDPHLDVVAVDGLGTMAAFALAWFDEVNLAGELEPVGTHPDHRRRGLARAVSLAALHRLRDRGADTAIVYAAEGAADTPDLYRSLGFEQIDRNRAWIKR